MRADRGVLMALGFFALACGASIGLIAFIGAQREQSIALRRPLAPTVTPRPTVTPIQVGSVGALTGAAGYGYALVWVEELGMSAWERAYENRDERGMNRVMDVFETLRIPDGDTVRITAMHGQAIQVEVLTGSMAGRRGWTDRGAFIRR